MKTETANLPRSITNNLRITSIAILVIIFYLVIPKSGNTTQAFSAVTVHRFSSSGERVNAPRTNSEKLKQTYTPPNYGGPDSQHGSGTR